MHDTAENRYTVVLRLIPLTYSTTVIHRRYTYARVCLGVVTVKPEPVDLTYLVTDRHEVIGGHPDEIGQAQDSDGTMRQRRRSNDVVHF